MKRAGPSEHSPPEVLALANPPSSARAPATDAREWDVESIYAAHADFVWASLHRLGVREADLPDCLQEVLVVVHRRLDSYDSESRITSWLYGICVKVAAAHRRRAHVRREDLRAEARLVSEPSHAPSPEDAAARSEGRRKLEEVLDGMDLEKRAVFVMFELEGLACAEIAEILAVPVGTVHSRLHHARAAFEKSLARAKARDRGGRS